MREGIAQEDHRHIRHHHAARGPGDDYPEVRIGGGQSHCGDLGLISYLRDEEGDQGGQEGACAADSAGPAVLKPASPMAC